VMVPHGESGQPSRAIVNPMDLTGRTILVTGGSSGIGRGTAILLSQLGARLLIVGRSHDKLAETLSELAGDDHIAESFDLGHVEEIPDWLENLAGQSGALDGIVHCAGISVLKPLRILTVKTIREVLSINLEAALMLARGFRRRNVCRNGGALVLVSSVAAVRGRPGLSAYAASKGGLLAVTRSLAAELAPDHIRINCVVPGFVETPMYRAFGAGVPEDQLAATVNQHLLGVGRPVDVANAIAFLLGDASRWITGESVVVDGGFLA